MEQERYPIYGDRGKETNCVYHVSDCSSNSGVFFAIKGYVKVFAILVAAVFVLYFRSEVMTRIFVSGESMNPTYQNDDVVFLLECGFSVKRYDVVVARSEIGDVIKRVVGVPGDTVLIENGTVYINGQRIVSDFDFWTESGGAESKFTISEDCYFLLGDNRQNSIDSRMFGEIDKKDIKGVVLFKIFPPFF